MSFEISETTQQKLDLICRKYHVRKLSIFGSTLHGEARPDSDLDVLVEFIPGHVPELFRFAGLQREESSVVLSRNVDLRTAEDLSQYFRDNVVKEAQLIYA
ncbi:MAG: nucleotidyltransferase domain-containing protein [Ignavibacteriae bacterium]|nr:nucleotidyltransferase domain-containing protein [Ignavibacteriota bacterium]